MKKLHRNRGLDKREGGLLEREGVSNWFVSFPSEKHVFILVGILFFIIFVW